MTLRDDLQGAVGADYTVERELGGGGMSRVFLAIDQAFGRRVVVKVLPPEMAAGVNTERFRREITTAARLQHAHIVPVLAAGEIRTPAIGIVPFFTMPYVEGESLRSRLSHGELPIGEVISILRDVAKALAYAHSHGVVHRDIKPDNVMLAGGAASVTDFGVAKAIGESASGDRITATGFALGTPGYMAPEQAAGDPALDHRADIYAFGILAYEMLTGAAPFAGRPPQQMLAAHATEPIASVATMRPKVPAMLSNLVAHCLEKRPAERPQSAQEIVLALEELATPTGQAPFATSAASPHKASRQRIVLSIVGALVIVVVGIVVWRRGSTHETVVRRVAVAPFENLTGDSSLAQIGRIAADWMTQGIAQAESIDVVSSATVMSVLGDAKRSNQDVVRQLGAATHVSAVVTGSVSKFGDSLRVAVQLVNAKSGEIIRALQPAVGPVADPLSAIQALRERVLGSLASGDLARRVHVGGDPPKYAAYTEFLEGQDRFTHRDWPAAQKHVSRALQLDSSFAFAYVTLATAFWNANMRDSAAAVAEQADQKREQFDVSDRLALDGLDAMIRDDPETGLRVDARLAQRDSSWVALYNVGLDATQMLRPGIAIPALIAADSGALAASWPLELTVLANAYHEIGDHQSELKVLERGRKIYPSDPSFPRRELIAYAALRRPEAGLRLADTLLADIPQAPAALINSILSGANEYAAHGDPATGERFNQLVVGWFTAHPAKVKNPLEAANGRALLSVGMLDSAEKHFRAAAKDSVTAPVAGFLALIAIRRGDSSRARAVSDSLADTHPKWDLGQTPYWRAAIAAALGDRAGAVGLLREAGHGYGQPSWHADRVLQSLRGYAPFEELIRPRK